VLVMPALHSANLSSKLLQELGAGTVIGPLLSGLERSVQIVPMGYGVGLRKSLREPRIVKRNAKNALAREGAPHFHGRRPMRVGKHGITQAEPIERAEDVRPELYAGADLPELGGLLNHMRRKAFARQRVCCGEASDASTGNQDRKGIGAGHYP